MSSITRRGLILNATAASTLLFAPRIARAAEPLRIGLAAIYTPFAVANYASQKGYLGNSEVTVYRGGAAAQEALAAGAADIAAVSPPTAALAIQKGVDQKIIAQSGPPTMQGWYLVTSPDSGIKSVKDLEGKQVGITAKGSATDFMAAWSAHKAKASFDMIPLGGGILPAVEAGQIQAGVIWPLPSFKSLAAGETVALQEYGVDVTDAAIDMWAASGTALATKSDQVRQFVTGLNQAIAELQGDEELALKVLAEFHDESDTALLKTAYEKLIKTLRADSAPTLAGINGSLDMAKLAGLTGLPDAAAISDLSLVSPS